MRQDWHDHPSEIGNLLKWLLRLTDQAWQSHAVGIPFEFARVEQEFGWLLDSIEATDFAHEDEADPAIAKIISTLTSSNLIAKRHGKLKAFELLVQATGPFTNRAKCLDTSNR